MLHRLLLLFFVGLTTLALGQAPTTIPSIYNINVPFTTEKITLDGNPNEAVWAQCSPAKDFFQVFPFDTSFAKTKTEIFACYDNDNIYFTAVCYDEFPDKEYVIQTLRRDFLQTTDVIAFYIDPFGDGLNGFEFGVNPLGVEREGLIANGNGFDFGWDNKWQSQVTRYPDRWVAEIAIPFKTLRFKQGSGSWKINFGRVDMKRNERSAWVPVPRNFALRTLAFTGNLNFEKPLDVAGNKLAIIPYITGGATKNYEEGTSAKLMGNVGVDAKVAVTSALNLDITINPDFSQVEVDRQVTNLSRFELFFPERRQFFIENSDVFSRFGFSQIRPFFSRRIGVGRDPFTGQFKQNTIYGGARLSGRINEKWRIGVMSMQAAADSSINLPGNNYTVAAVQRQIFSRSNIAAIFVNRQELQRPDGTFAFNSQGFNRIVGLDYNLASKDNKWDGKFFYHQSLQPNQPKDAYTHASYLGYYTPTFTFMWNHEYVGENYRAETGFVPRSNMWRIEPGIGFSVFPKKENAKVNNYRFYLYNNAYINREFNKLLDLSNDFSFNINYESTASISTSFGREFIYLFFPFDPSNTGGVELPASSTYTTYYGNAGYMSDTRKKFTYSADFDYSQYFNGILYGPSVEVGYRLQPFGQFGLSVDYNVIQLPQPYTSARLLLIGPQVDIAFTKKIFLTAFFQYNNQIQNINSNIRFQWRFAPVSDLFIVYSDNYLSNNFGVRNRGIVVKLNYWFNL